MGRRRFVEKSGAGCPGPGGRRGEASSLELAILPTRREAANLSGGSVIRPETRVRLPVSDKKGPPRITLSGGKDSGKEKRPRCVRTPRKPTGNTKREASPRRRRQGGISPIYTKESLPHFNFKRRGRRDPRPTTFKRKWPLIGKYTKGGNRAQKRHPRGRRCDSA